MTLIRQRAGPGDVLSWCPEDHENEGLVLHASNDLSRGAEPCVERKTYEPRASLPPRSSLSASAPFRGSLPIT